MDDFECPFDEFPFLQGVDLTLWLQILVGALVLLGAGLVAATALG
jgi:hypothetical protein